jgi:hypothetical protein
MGHRGFFVATRGFFVATRGFFGETLPKKWLVEPIEFCNYIYYNPHSARVILNYNIFHTPFPSVKGSSWALPLNSSPLLSLLPLAPS